MYSIILPSYNEKKNLILLIKKIKIILKNINFEIIIVDDNSPDKTYVYFKKNYSKDKKIKFFLRTEERGLAKSIYFGIRKARGKFVIVMDSDFNHNPKYLKTFINVQNKLELDFISGSRFTNGGSSNKIHRHILSKIFNIYIQKLLNIKIKDSLSGFFLIRTKIIKKKIFKEIFDGYGEYFIKLCFFIEKKKYSFREIGVRYGNRKYGVSKSKFLKMFFIYSLTALKLLFNIN